MTDIFFQISISHDYFSYKQFEEITQRTQVSLQYKKNAEIHIPNLHTEFCYIM